MASTMSASQYNTLKSNLQTALARRANPKQKINDKTVANYGSTSYYTYYNATD